MHDASALQKVRRFWNTEACGTDFVQPSGDDREYFRRFRAFRYRTEWHIPAFADFAGAAAKRVLEIGCGNGADAVMFARNGADYTGIDLTPEATSATRRHLVAEGLEGRLRQQNVEQLDFAEASFDLVYSFGVLHHTPAPERAVREVHRVLKPGGVALVMLYHRRSFNYYVRILGYMRVRILLRILARTGRWSEDRRRCDDALRGVRGNTAGAVWDLHYHNFLRQGWRYLAARNLVHHCTDGPECPCAYTYSRREAATLFGDFRSVRTRIAHFPLRKYPGGKFVPRFVEAGLARVIGWHVLIRAQK